VNLVADPAGRAEFMGAAEGSAVLDGEEIDAETGRGETISVDGVAGKSVTGTGECFTPPDAASGSGGPPLRSGTRTRRSEVGRRTFGGVDYALTVASA
jgi:hypothetical protein